jgi:hypothetical protein
VSEELQKECNRLAARNTLLVNEIDTLRQQLRECRERNVKLLSQLQEFEAREY